MAEGRGERKKGNMAEPIYCEPCGTFNCANCLTLKQPPPVVCPCCGYPVCGHKHQIGKR